MMLKISNNNYFILLIIQLGQNYVEILNNLTLHFKSKSILQPILLITPQLNFTYQEQLLLVIKFQKLGRWGIRELQIQADKKVFTKSFVKDDKSMVFWYSFTDALQIMDCQNQNFKLVYIQRDKILRKQLTSIPNHQRILVSFEVVVIYQFKFNNSRYLYLNIDGQNVWKQNFILTSEISLCDSTNRSQKFFFEAWLDHSSSTAILEFQADGSGLLEPAIYFGLRNINIQYEKILVS
ncbi:unnamed protein product [Paramecium octaurelia]|uniref:Uncharacterized protein n=1 Tax=Paramecium octaurelia TaxID=43137 RepID=A0A8S1Y2S9_PAROT|nr:unnamed protein product [Paramecium octaurelia]